MTQHHRVWRGTAQEYARLVSAVEHNCPNGCAEGTLPQGQTCSVHGMLTDQDRLNHLEAASFDVNRRLLEEGIGFPHPDDGGKAA